MWPVNTTGKTKGWPVNSPISPDIAHWPAIVLSPDICSNLPHGLGKDPTCSMPVVTGALGLEYHYCYV